MSATATVPAEGLYYDVPEAEYRAWPAMNYSRIKLLDESVEVFKYHETHAFAATDAMEFGSAVDMELVPSLYGREVVMGLEDENGEKLARRSNDAKAKWAKFEADNADKIILTRAEIQRVNDIKTAIAEHAEIARILKAGRSQVCMVWVDRETGVLCKGKLDRVVDEEALYDVKTARDVAHGVFSRVIADLGYAIQAALYRDGYKKITGVDLPFRIIAIQSTAPHRCKLYRMNKEGMMMGRLKYRRALYQFKLCMQSGIWKDPQIEEEIGPPAWCLREEGIEPEREF